MNPLAQHYRRFRVDERILLTGHSHQAWPDVALDGHVEAFADAADHVDAKWSRAFAKAERVRDGFRALLGDPVAEIALGASTHDLVLRFLSALDLRRRPRLLTTDGEFHTLRRQLARLSEDVLPVTWVAARPVETLAERLAASIDAATSAVLVSAVLFEDARIVPHLGELAGACRSRSVELLVDVYHALGPVPYDLATQRLMSAWVVGGGYKYLQLGEGNCFLRLPPHAEASRPVVTGWYAEFEELEAVQRRGGVAYGRGAAAFQGATYDPTSHYRAARVFDFFAEQGLTSDRLRSTYLRQLRLLAEGFDQLALPDDIVTRDRATPLDRFGGFLALQTSRAADMQRALAVSGVCTDHRGPMLRLGPAPYVADEQLVKALDCLAGVARGPRG